MILCRHPVTYRWQTQAPMAQATIKPAPQQDGGPSSLGPSKSAQELSFLGSEFLIGEDAHRL